MNTRLALSALVLSSVAAANAQSTFATFSNTGTLIFTRTLNGFTGTGTVSNFVFGGTTYNNVGFTMSALTVMNPPSIVSAGELTGGSFAFTDGGTELMSAVFGSARLTSNGTVNTAFNSSANEGDTLTFSGVTGTQDMNGFSFALSPLVGQPNKYTSSFSAVGNVQAVPEPASMAALGLGALALIRRRRNRA